MNSYFLLSFTFNKFIFRSTSARNRNFRSTCFDPGRPSDGAEDVDPCSERSGIELQICSSKCRCPAQVDTF